MKFNKFAIIFVASGADPKKDRATIKTDTFTYTTVGVPSEDKKQVIEVAKELAKDGAQIIELCGGFGPIWMGKVIEALKGSVPVGGVFYGPEARKELVDLGLVHPYQHE